MQKFTIHVKDETKVDALISLLKELNFVDVVRDKDIRPRLSQKGNMRALFGIWKNRDITIVDIRKKAWR